MFSRICPPAPIRSSTGSTPYSCRSQKFLSFHASSQMVSASCLPSNCQQLLTLGGCEVAHLVKDVVAGQQAFGLDGGDLSVAQQRRRVQHRLAGSGIGRSDQAADDGNALASPAAIDSAVCRLRSTNQERSTRSRGG